MDKAQLVRLKERAEKATPGEWQHCFARGRWDGWIIDEQNRDILKEVSNFRENAAFIAAANPATVLALIAEIEQLDKEADWLAKQALAKDQSWRYDGFLVDIYRSIEEWRKAARKAVEESNAG